LHIGVGLLVAHTPPVNSPADCRRYGSAHVSLFQKSKWSQYITDYERLARCLTRRFRATYICRFAQQQRHEQREMLLPNESDIDSRGVR
jgi:hypothetical protein